MKNFSSFLLMFMINIVNGSICEVRKGRKLNSDITIDHYLQLNTLFQVHNFKFDGLPDIFQPFLPGM